MAPQYTLGEYHTAVLPLLQPLDGPCFSMGRGALRTSVSACCCHNRCLQHGLGRYMQGAGSLGALDGAFSVSEECLVFGPAYSHVVLRPRPGYVPKVPTTPFCDQVVNLQALPSEEADPALALLCPVRALRIYVDRTLSFRSSEQLFVCHGGQQKGKAVSKQRLAHWIVDAIALAYQSQGEPCPLGVRAHSTRSVASSYALAHGASLADICRAAGWATPNTFARFYSLRVEPVSSRVLGNR